MAEQAEQVPEIIEVHFVRENHEVIVMTAFAEKDVIQFGAPKGVLLDLNFRNKFNELMREFGYWR